MTTPMSAEDLRMLHYFWKEKGDLSRWTGLEAAWPRIEAGLPELAKAWRDATVTPRIVKAVLHYLHSKMDERKVSQPLTDEELSELWWVWTDREDLSEVSWFASRRPSLERDYPELVRAWDDYLSALDAMNMVMERVSLLANEIDD